MNATKPDAVPVPSGFPPDQPGALVIVVHRRVAWVLVTLGSAAVVLLGIIAWRLDVLATVVAVQRR